MTTATASPSEVVAANGAALARGKPQDLRIVHDEGEFANLLDTAKFEHMWRVAQVFAKSNLVPQHFRDKPEDCFICTQMAVRLRVDPFMLLQNTYVVHGRPGMEAKLAIALINSSGLFTDSLDYEIQGGPDPFADGYRVRAFAVRKSTGKRVDGPWIDWGLVRKERWDKKDGSKWLTMPAQMFCYRAAAFFGRLHCPERLMGMQTRDELEDVGPEAKVVQNLAELPEGRTEFTPPKAEVVAENRNYALEETKPAAPGDAEPPSNVEEANERVRRIRANGQAASAAANSPASDATGTPVEGNQPPTRSKEEIAADLERAKNGCRVGTFGCSSDISIDKKTKRPVCSVHAPRT